MKPRLLAKGGGRTVAFRSFLIAFVMIAVALISVLGFHSTSASAAGKENVTDINVPADEVVLASEKTGPTDQVITPADYDKFQDQYDVSPNGPNTITSKTSEVQSVESETKSGTKNTRKKTTTTWVMSGPAEQNPTVSNGTSQENPTQTNNGWNPALLLAIPAVAAPLATPVVAGAIALPAVLAAPVVAAVPVVAAAPLALAAPVVAVAAAAPVIAVPAVAAGAALNVVPAALSGAALNAIPAALTGTALNLLPAALAAKTAFDAGKLAVAVPAIALGRIALGNLGAIHALNNPFSFPFGIDLPSQAGRLLKGFINPIPEIIKDHIEDVLVPAAVANAALDAIPVALAAGAVLNAVPAAVIGGLLNAVPAAVVASLLNAIPAALVGAALKAIPAALVGAALNVLPVAALVGVPALAGLNLLGKLARDLAKAIPVVAVLTGIHVLNKLLPLLPVVAVLSDLNTLNKVLPLIPVAVVLGGLHTLNKLLPLIPLAVIIGGGLNVLPVAVLIGIPALAGLNLLGKLAKDLAKAIPVVAVLAGLHVLNKLLPLLPVVAVLSGLHVLNKLLPLLPVAFVIGSNIPLIVALKTLPVVAGLKALGDLIKASPLVAALKALPVVLGLATLPIVALLKTLGDIAKALPVAALLKALGDFAKVLPLIVALKTLPVLAGLKVVGDLIKATPIVAGLDLLGKLLKTLPVVALLNALGDLSKALPVVAALKALPFLIIPWLPIAFSLGGLFALNHALPLVLTGLGDLLTRLLAGLSNLLDPFALGGPIYKFISGLLNPGKRIVPLWFGKLTYEAARNFLAFLFFDAVGQLIFPYIAAFIKNFNIQVTLDTLYLVANMLLGTGGIYYFTTILYHIAAVFAITFAEQELTGILYGLAVLGLLLPKVIARDVLVSAVIINDALLPGTHLISNILFGNAILFAQNNILKSIPDLVAGTALATIALDAGNVALALVSPVGLTVALAGPVIGFTALALVIFVLSYLAGTAGIPT